MQDLCNLKHCIRPGVRVTRTSVVADASGFGLYAPENEDLERGSFIGVYSGDSWRWAGMGGAYRGKNNYVMQVGAWRTSPKMSSPSMQVNIHKYKMMAMQEPPPGVTANCQFVYFSRASDIGADVSKSKSISCVAAYTACAVAAGKELFVHYGDEKNRDYDVGFSAPVLYKKDIKDCEYPHVYTLHCAPCDGWRPCKLDPTLRKRARHSTL